MPHNLDKTPVMLTALEGNAQDLRQQLLDKALSSLYYFSKVVMNFKDMTPTYHLAKCEEIQSSIWKRRRGFLWSRATFKSTIIGKSYLLWRLAGGGYKKFDYTIPAYDPRNKRWLAVGESDARVVRNVKNIKEHLTQNQMLRWLFPDIIPTDVNKTTWRDDEILLPRSSLFDEGTIKAIGIGGKITGYHGDGFIYDDPIGEEAARSEPVMQRANDWFDLSSGLENDPDQTEVLFAGTRWKHGRADLYGRLMEDLPFSVNGEGKPSGIEWYVHSIYDENGNSTFPERLPNERLEQILRQQKTYLFSCQYLNTPSTPAGADFPEHLIKSYTIESRHDSDGKERFDRLVPNDGTPPVNLSQLRRITFFDPSSGGKSAVCENAIICLGSAADGRHFVLKAWLKNAGYREAIEEWHRINDQFICANNYYESVGAQKTIEEFVMMMKATTGCVMCSKTHRRLVPQGIKPPGGREKDDRIRLYLQPCVEEGRLYLGPGQAALRVQLVSFPHFNLKDGADGVAYAVHESKRPMTEVEIRDEKAVVDAAMMPREARTQTSISYGGYV